MDKFRRIIGILLIIIGVVIIGDVAYKKIITLNKQKEIVKLNRIRTCILYVL